MKKKKKKKKKNLQLHTNIKSKCNNEKNAFKSKNTIIIENILYTTETMTKMVEYSFKRNMLGKLQQMTLWNVFIIFPRK